jgi:hypothetical protein
LLYYFLSSQIIGIAVFAHMKFVKRTAVKYVPRTQTCIKYNRKYQQSIASPRNVIALVNLAERQQDV